MKSYLNPVIFPMLGVLILCVLFSIPAFADHVAVDVAIPAGSATPGCEATNECYIEAEVTIDAGSEVVWSNEDSASHTVTSGDPKNGQDGRFDSGLFLSGQTFSHTFEEAGEFPYFCLVHPWMQGTVVVGQGSSQEFDANYEPIIVVTDEAHYDAGDVVSIYGKVGERLSGYDVTLELFSANGNLVTRQQLPVLDDNTFELELIADGPLWRASGTYTVKALYGTATRTAETTFEFSGSGNIIPPSIEEILIQSTEDGSLYAVITPTGLSTQQNLSFELSFEDVDDNLIEHVNFDVVATQDDHMVLAETQQHTHGGTMEFTTAPLISDNPLDVQVTILGIGLPDDNQNWTLAGGETLALRLIDFTIQDESDEEPPQTDLPYSADVSIPAGSSTPGCEQTNECFIESEVTINVGGEVVWSNDDNASHTVTSGDPKNGSDRNFDSGLFLTGQTFTHRFDQEGEYPYFCLVHPWMQGTVFVGQGAPNPNPTPTPIIDLVVDVDESEYDLGEMATLNVGISGTSSPQNVAITVTDPFGTIMVSRTLTTDSNGNASTNFNIAESFKTGTYRIDATSSINGRTYSDTSMFRVTSQFNQIQIVSAQGTDQQGNPMEFSRGNMGFVKVQVSAQKPIATLITVNVFDSDLTPLGVGSLKTTLNTGQSELILSFMIPEDAVVGNADIYVNALSDWVSAGGIPQTGEFAGQVRIN